MIIKEFCTLANIAENQFDSIEKLDLSNKDLISLSEGLNPHVEGNLDLSNKDLKSFPEGFNLNGMGDLVLFSNELI